MSESQGVQTTTVSLLDNGVSLKGDLLYSTVSYVFTQGRAMLENHNAFAIAIDMSEVEKIDSAGIALLLAWKRLCDENNKNYQLKGTSQQATSLINTNNLEAVLNLGR